MKRSKIAEIIRKIPDEKLHGSALKIVSASPELAQMVISDIMLSYDKDGKNRNLKDPPQCAYSVNHMVGPDIEKLPKAS